MGSTADEASRTVWVVVGASRGLGLEFARQLVSAEGTKVVAAARDPAKSAGLQDLKAEHPNDLSLVTMDITDESSAKAAAEAVTEQHPGGIDYLIVNAGVHDRHYGPGITADLQNFKRVMDTNVFGAFAAVQAFYPLLKSKADGKKTVVMETSLSAVMTVPAQDARDIAKPFLPYERVNFLYKTSKTALNQMTVQFANELKKEGFTFIPIEPGVVETDMQAEAAAASEEMAALLQPMVISAEQSVREQLTYIKAAKQETANGLFVTEKGDPLPW